MNMKEIPYKRPLGVILGILLGILATLVLEMDLLAVVLGALFAVFISGCDQAREGALIGFLSGIGLGFYLGIRNAIVHDIDLTLRILPSLIATVILSGLLGAFYAFLTAKLKPLYDKGQGPFF